MKGMMKLVLHLLIDAKNTCDECCRKLLCWVYRHIWPFGVRFILNIYRHRSILAMRGESKKRKIYT